MDNIVFEDCSIFDRSDEEPKSLILSTNVTNKVPLVGHYRKSTVSIEIIITLNLL